MKFFKKFLNKRNKSNSNTVYVEEQYLRTEVIYNVKENFIILISFSKEYFSSMIELLTYCNRACGLEAQYAHSIFVELSDEKDAFGDFIRIYHDRHYILIGGNPNAYRQLYYFTDNTANSILEAISLEIYNHRTSSDFENLIKDGILSKNSFKYKDIKPDYDDYARDKPEYASYDNTSLIMKRLPDCFSGQSLLRFINCYIPDDYAAYVSAYDIASGYRITSEYELLIDNDYKKLYEDLIKNPNKEILTNFAGPQYLVRNEEAVVGDISDDQLDEIFKQQYDRFNAIRDNFVQYEDIDEIISPNAESKNMRKTDILNNLNTEEEE